MQMQMIIKKKMYTTCTMNPNYHCRHHSSHTPLQPLSLAAIRAALRAQARARVAGSSVARRLTSLQVEHDDISGGARERATKTRSKREPLRVWMTMGTCNLCHDGVSSNQEAGLGRILYPHVC
jgi:hypothetical protein